MKAFPGRIVVALLVLLLAAPLGFAEYKEAPMLARLVAAGELPPVDERLPDNPFVVGPGVLNGTQWVDWTPGNYSDGRKVRTLEDSLHQKIPGAGHINILWSPDNTTTDPVGTIVESFNFSDDYTVFDFTIRKGLKWSNGDLVTTDDVKFAFDDLYEYPDAKIPYPVQLHSLGNPRFPVAELTVQDRHSFTLTFDRPYGFLRHGADFLDQHGRGRDLSALGVPEAVPSEVHGRRYAERHGGGGRPGRLETAATSEDR